jgi:superfamily II DNA or RNA helicase
MAAGRYLSRKKHRRALWASSGGRCWNCGEPLPPGWHADHVLPFARTGRTNLHEMQALCPRCNRKKGALMYRKHQAELHSYLQTSEVSVLHARRQLVVHVCPGGGKSVLPVIAAHALLRKGMIDKVAVIVPRLTLKRQGAQEFQKTLFRSLLGHRLEIRESCNDDNPDRGTAGYITTYNAVCEDPDRHLDFFRLHRCLLVLDEVHHVAEGSRRTRPCSRCTTWPPSGCS